MININNRIPQDINPQNRERDNKIEGEVPSWCQTIPKYNRFSGSQVGGAYKVTMRIKDCTRF